MLIFLHVPMTIGYYFWAGCNKAHGKTAVMAAMTKQPLEALLIRFALQIQTCELEALEKHAAGQHQMRAKETDPAPIITDDRDLPALEVRPRAATAAAVRNTAHQASGAGESNRGCRGRGGKLRDKGRPRATAAGTGMMVLGKHGRDLNPAEWMT
ncbi:hypothetical protein VOLCADRAFT_90407 [Volvox carteri f. nagariensis]|uniref:Uncharacterized protein n=1 Tax=Volvox carteri f. nagariensis TaxID=3068 RepID=D8TUA4_VOLCA|nr:uncharacterized protein VOLCADRAFT_90407 [Volvox carteri f. nagariensis]EFJ49110.1 hypothetical protein VOLCADRAFT_90407 [Volvox carteri f. nagariensis]|eukprot:XP_002950007.1 hypothetical protein VOLCADRAFT_90407 [Volvox carteri f. nagariensis]